MGFSTDAIHAGQKPDPNNGAVIPPIYQTSTYEQEALGKPRGGYEYARTQNPTREALEKNLAALEQGQFGVAFGSGLAAIGCLLQSLQAGDHVLFTDNLYGGTYRLADKVWRKFGLQFSFVDTSKLDNVKKGLQPNTRLVFLETPTNPVLTVSDIQAIADLAHDHGAKLAVDNTFMTPFLQRPLQLGADLVVHSTTKYLNGHSDMVGGMIVLNDSEMHERLRFLQNAAGAVPGPFDCWLALRGTKTLALRMAAHEGNARELARLLATHPRVQKCYYPGLAQHPQHALATKQASGYGGIVSIDLGSRDSAAEFMQSLQIFYLAESLGGVESLVCHPASMTHASVPYEDRQRLGVTDGLVRLSAGVEDMEDLVKDVTDALARISSPAGV
jgi:cystathionine beta-lyase/cystathionine gamma-synthase